jgi:hypothetical protein
VHETLVRGLQGVRYRDKALDKDEVVESRCELDDDREIDRVYRGIPKALEVEEAHRATIVHAEGFVDTVLWNPGAHKGRDAGGTFNPAATHTCSAWRPRWPPRPSPCTGADLARSTNADGPGLVRARDPRLLPNDVARAARETAHRALSGQITT